MAGTHRRRVDPPRWPASDAQRQARKRARRKKGIRIYRLELHDHAVEGLIDMMLTSGQLTTREADDHRMIEAKLARLG